MVKPRKLGVGTKHKLGSERAAQDILRRSVTGVKTSQWVASDPMETQGQAAGKR